MITFFSIVLDGMPWLRHHYPVFCQLKMPWRWIVVEGVADNVNCTSWCAKIPPRLSSDGTTEYIAGLAASDSRVTHLRQPLWAGKVQMCNAALARIDQPCLLWQVDADELWTKEQIEAVARLFASNPSKNCAFFFCKYFIGPDIFISNRGGFGNHESYEWKRVWRFTPGMRFKTHEPPVIEGMIERPFMHKQTEEIGCVFNHYAYASEAQMQFKQTYYSGRNNPNTNLYANAVEGWRRLQSNKVWPTKLKPFLNWVDCQATVDKVDR